MTKIAENIETSDVIELKSHYLYLLYHIMTKRILKGYSAEDLAFLTGLELNYFTELEMLMSADKKLKYLEENRSLLKEVGFDEVFGIPYYDTVHACRIIKITTRDHIFYQLEKKNPKNEFEILFVLMDETRTIDPWEEFHERDRNQIEALVRTLIDIGYFDFPVKPYDIYKKCQSFLRNQISPYNLLVVLKKLMVNNKSKALIYKSKKYSSSHFLVKRKRVYKE